MILNNKLFTILKWILATAVAPTIALITGLGELYNFDTTIIVGTINWKYLKEVPYVCSGYT